jgi:hypothetical protein
MMLKTDRNSSGTNHAHERIEEVQARQDISQFATAPNPLDPPEPVQPGYHAFCSLREIVNQELWKPF